MAALRRDFSILPALQENPRPRRASSLAIVQSRSTVFREESTPTVNEVAVLASNKSMSPFKFPLLLFPSSYSLVCLFGFEWAIAFLKIRSTFVHLHGRPLTGTFCSLIASRTPFTVITQVTGGRNEFFVILSLADRRTFGGYAITFRE